MNTINVLDSRLSTVLARASTTQALAPLGDNRSNGVVTAIVQFDPCSGHVNVIVVRDETLHRSGPYETCR
jgi:hypothetical protein